MLNLTLHVGLRRCDARHRDAIRATRDVIQPLVATKANGARVTAVLTADTELKPLSMYVGIDNRHLNEATHCPGIQRNKRV